MPSRALKTVGQIFATATALAILSATILYNITVGSGQPHAAWYRLVALNAVYWYLWAILATPIVWLAARFRLERRTWKRSLPLHLVGVTTFAILHIIGVNAYLYVTAVTPWRMSFRDGVRRAVLQNFDWEIVTYLAIVGVTHAVLYYRESQERRLAAAALETELARAQLQNLRRQLHPHFLFNTLNAIAALMHRNVQAADDMLTGLADLLRLSLDRADVLETSLEEELGFARKYVAIQCARFQDRLTVNFAVEPETLEALVPALILQPLVENAIEHGIAPRSGRGHIDIVARREGNTLVMEVRDDGVGWSSRRPAEGIGLSATRARLAYQYGAAARLEFEHPSAGFVARIVIPWRAQAAAGVERESALTACSEARP